MNDLLELVLNMLYGEDMICATIPCDKCELREMCNNEIKNKISQDEKEDDNNEL